MRAKEQSIAIVFFFVQKDNYMHFLLFQNLKTPLFCYSWHQMKVSAATIFPRSNCQKLSFKGLFCSYLAYRY